MCSGKGKKDTKHHNVVNSRSYKIHSSIISYVKLNSYFSFSFLANVLVTEYKIYFRQTRHIIYQQSYKI